MSAAWTQAQALDLCRRVETVCPAFGCHVALTGGLLYKDGERKDCDILFYRIRQVEEIDREGLFAALQAAINFERVGGFDWCIKAKFEGRDVDCFFPESSGEEYPQPDPDDMAAEAAEYRAEQRRDDLMMERF